MGNFYKGAIMAKRYHNSKRSIEHDMERHNDERRHDAGRERFGSYPYDRQNTRPMDEYYAGSDSRRRQELEDAGMIHEDHRAIANLPQEVRIMAYPKTGPYMPEGLDDTLRGIDQQVNYDDSQRKKHFFPKKV